MFAGVTDPSAPPSDVDIGAMTTRFGMTRLRNLSGLNRCGKCEPSANALLSQTATRVVFAPFFVLNQCFRKQISGVTAL